MTESVHSLCRETWGQLCVGRRAKDGAVERETSVVGREAALRVSQWEWGKGLRNDRPPVTHLSLSPISGRQKLQLGSVGSNFQEVTQKVTLRVAGP